MIFYNVSDSLCYSKAIELTTGKSIALSDIFLKVISAKIALLNHSSPTDGISGLLMISNNAVLLSSHPIVKHNKSGPILGHLIMGRFLNDEEFNYLSTLTNTTIFWKSYNDVFMPETFLHARLHFQTNTSALIRPFNDTVINGFFLLHDITGNPAVIVEILMARDVYQQG
jgi:sensor domain CHASE-containing protein